MNSVKYFLKYPLIVLLLGLIIGLCLYKYGPEQINPVADIIRPITILPMITGLSIGGFFNTKDLKRAEWLKGKRAVTRQLTVLIGILLTGTLLMAVLASLAFTDSRVFASIDWGCTLSALIFSCILATLYMRILMIPTGEDWRV